MPVYWNEARGPRLQEAVFRNDLSPDRALELVCETEGEVDILTEVAPEDAGRVEESEHARLVSLDAMRCVVGIIDRDADGLPLGKKHARQAERRRRWPPPGPAGRSSVGFRALSGHPSSLPVLPGGETGASGVGWRGGGFAELAAVEVRVEAAGGEELGVGAALGDAAVLHDENPVGVPDRA